MTSHPEFLIVQGAPVLAGDLVGLVVRCAARAELAVTLGHAVARLHNRAFAGVIVDAASDPVGTVSFAEQVRSDGFTLPIFAFATTLLGSVAQRLSELEGCTAGVLHAGWQLELQHWVLATVGSEPRKLEPSAIFTLREADSGEASGAMIRELAGVRR